MRPKLSVIRLQQFPVAVSNCGGADDPGRPACGQEGPETMGRQSTPKTRSAHTESQPAAGPAPTSPVPERQIANDTRRRLIETAARHFAEYGFEGASLRAIHREMGANPATTHYHFGSKLAVYEAIVDAYFTRVQKSREASFTAIDEGLGGRERLTALIKAYVLPHLEVVAGESG
ncbi:MAG: TetR/AcrR family transcriptional regulator, partial [Sphingomonas sp.]